MGGVLKSIAAMMILATAVVAEEGAKAAAPAAGGSMYTLLVLGVLGGLTFLVYTVLTGTDKKS